MAKGKHSVALFEVIQSSKASKPGFTLRTPKWWFKGRKSATKAPEAPALPEPEPQPETEMVVAEQSMPAPRAHRLDMLVDPDRQRITFHISYTTAIVAAFAVIVTVVLAYVIGQHMRQGPAPALAGTSTEQVRQGPPQPGVLDVGGQRQSPQPEPQKQQPRPSDQNTGAGQQVQAPGVDIARPGKRIVGKNYIVVQIYRDEASAIEVRDLLQKNNVPCTIEKGLRDYAVSSWYCVVTLAGFDRISSQEYRNYLAELDRVNGKIVDNPKYKKFDPHPYSWRG